MNSDWKFAFKKIQNLNIPVSIWKSNLIINEINNILDLIELRFLK